MPSSSTVLSSMALVTHHGVAVTDSPAIQMIAAMSASSSDGLLAVWRMGED